MVSAYDGLRCGRAAEEICERMNAMPTQEYREAKKELINCLLMSVFGCGVPIVIAFKEWWPIMKAEKAKMNQAQ